MVDNSKKPKLVGSFIRQRREAIGLSQRALGLLFNPPVTTQFISNVERGVTPLPPNHVPTLSRALQISESEMLAVLEKEYTAKLSGRLGREDAVGHVSNGSGGAPMLAVASQDLEFMRQLYDAYRSADAKTRQAFSTVCSSMLNLVSTADTKN